MLPNVQFIKEIGAFKKAITPCNTNKGLINIGVQKIQIIHAQLLLGCSILASHLCNIHVKDSSNCFACNEIKDCYHLFFKCNLYTSARNKLHAVVNKLSTFHLNTLLYGDPYNSDEDNVKIFLAVHKFIKESGRFDI